MSETLGPWFTATVLCLACGHRWVAVYDGTPERFECPPCGKMEGVRE
jgi:predicted RNA-binding Zn-ribbon protein involved in translation (DUF1610 family)